jgi:hypothetical protein
MWKMKLYRKSKDVPDSCELCKKKFSIKKSENVYYLFYPGNSKNEQTKVYVCFDCHIVLKYGTYKEIWNLR